MKYKAKITSGSGYIYKEKTFDNEGEAISFLHGSIVKWDEFCKMNIFEFTKLLYEHNKYYQHKEFQVHKFIIEEVSE